MERFHSHVNLPFYTPTHFTQLHMYLPITHYSWYQLKKELSSKMDQNFENCQNTSVFFSLMRGKYFQLTGAVAVRSNLKS